MKYRYILALAAAMLFSPAVMAATSVGVPAAGPWFACNELADAAEIADLYADAGPEIGSSAWDHAVSIDTCHVMWVMLMPQEVVHRKGESRVMRLSNEDASLHWYAVTLQPVAGERPMSEGDF